jgi:hypothetical protein
MLRDTNRHRNCPDTVEATLVDDILSDALALPLGRYRVLVAE